jgi:hypothetical protein
MQIMDEMQQIANTPIPGTSGIQWSGVVVLAGVVASVALALALVFRRLIPPSDDAATAMRRLDDFPTTNFRSVSGTASFLLFWTVVLALEALGFRLRESLVDGLMWGIIVFAGVSALEKVGKWQQMRKEKTPDAPEMVQNINAPAASLVAGTSTTTSSTTTTGKTGVPIREAEPEPAEINPRISDPSRIDDPAEVIPPKGLAQGEAG